MSVQFSTILLIIMPVAFLLFAWVSIGTPKILKRTAMLAIIAPLLHLLLFILLADLESFFAFFIKDIIICFIPFLCVFFNARRFDKSLSFTRALMFWLPE